MTDPSERLFLFGPGYAARALARIWSGEVAASYRSETGLATVKEAGFRAISVDDPEGLKRATTGAHLVISAAPDAAGCPAWRALADFADAAASVTYLSTTGVYGDLGGGWAMEWSPVDPTSTRGERRVQAEQTWQAVSKRVRLVRLPGIYGPGRSAFDRLEAGTARRIVKPGQVFSRVHVDDIASGILALIEAQAFGVFNLCDDLAAPPQDVIACAAELIGAAPPPEIAFDDADLSAMAQSFYSECKRVSNARLKAATGWRPLYPTYREGLRAIRSRTR